MASVSFALGGLLFLALGYANFTRPAAMWKLYHFPLSAGQEAGDGVETTFRRRGCVFTAFGALICCTRCSWRSHCV